MLLQCPRCRAVQDDKARTCTKCGEPLTSPPAGAGARPAGRRRFGRSRSDVFHFAEPVPVAEVEQTAILPTPHPLARPTPPPPAPRKPTRAPAVAVGLILAVGAALFLRFGPALPHFVHPAPRTLTQPGSTPSQADGLTLVTSRPSGHAPVGSAVTVTASLSLAQNRSAHVSLFSRRGSGPSLLFSAAQGSQCRATWVPTAPGRYVLTATVQNDLRTPMISRSLTIIADPAKAPSAPAAPTPLGTTTSPASPATEPPRPSRTNSCGKASLPGPRGSGPEWGAELLGGNRNPRPTPQHPFMGIM